MLSAFEVIKKELQQYDLKSVSEASGITEQTLINWIEGTHIGRFENLVSVAYCIGYDIRIQAVRR